MKKLLLWIAAAAALMVGCPYLAVTFAGSAGMAVCFLLFYGVNPLFCGICGAYAGKNIQQLWPMPLAVAMLFLVGVWLFFEMGEPAFWLYGGCYLLIGIAAMGIRAFIKRKQQ